MNFNAQKQLVVNCTTGAVELVIDRQVTSVPASPSIPDTSFGLLPMDAPLVLWLENYVGMLESGAIGAEEICKQHHEAMGIPSSKSICLFPHCMPTPPSGLKYQGPIGSEAITHGVKVAVRILYIPEMSRQGRLVFSYSVTMELLVGYHLRVCQLVRRHWTIRDRAGQVLDEVEGEGVVGEFPVLRAGGEPFTYQSCTTTSDEGGSMDGHFEFVQGQLTEQLLQEVRAASFRQAHHGLDQEHSHGPSQHDTFRVAVAPFTFLMPYFVY